MISTGQTYAVHCHVSWLSFDNVAIAETWVIQDHEPRRVVAHLNILGSPSLEDYRMRVILPLRRQESGQIGIPSFYP